MSRSKKPAHLVLRDKLLRQTKQEHDPYRRMTRACQAGAKMLDRRPMQCLDVERALFHVAAMLAKELSF